MCRNFVPQEFFYMPSNSSLYAALQALKMIGKIYSVYTFNPSLQSDDVETPFLNFLRYGFLNHSTLFMVVSVFVPLSDVETPFLNFLRYGFLNHSPPFIGLRAVFTDIFSAGFRWIISVFRIHKPVLAMGYDLNSVLVTSG
ncbi:hypothetical protein ANN_04449 [Periplaneta americana]|uniref:Uncharacterized protein n=1 Tax=Periplaneta americana TaxID=6978 RepID=A0ABQ8T8L0_PERAM|nr:hypothetical protein ANN_04449 [Periplaneta americana]